VLNELVEQLDTTKKAWPEQLVAEEKQEVDEPWEQGYEAAKQGICFIGGAIRTVSEGWYEHMPACSRQTATSLSRGLCSQINPNSPAISAPRKSVFA